MTPRSKFNPDRAAGASLFDEVAPPNPPVDENPPGNTPPRKQKTADQPPITVSHASQLIADALADHMPQRLRVVGEISNLSRPGHWFFSLKDADAVLQCVAWASRARTFRIDPDEGTNVIATGTVRHYAPQGRTQLYVESLQVVGVGTLEQRFKDLCEKLRSLGYFEADRKKPIPFLPRRIAVITSGTGAALQDVLNTLAHRCPMVEVLVVDVRVQGTSAVSEIVDAIKHVDRHRRSLNVDALLLTRGGGSLEDLWAFNEQAVCEALFHCTLPKVVAVGHETDTTIAELVADLRCSTPTQAAMHMVPDASDLRFQLDHSARRLHAQIGHHLRLARRQFDHGRARLGRPEALVASAEQRLSERVRRLNSAAKAELSRCAIAVHTLASKLELQRPTRVISGRYKSVEIASFRLFSSFSARFESARRDLRAARTDLTRAGRHRLDQCRFDVDAQRSRLAALDPRSVLHRGYSITRAADGAIITSAARLAAGDEITTLLQDGAIESTVREAKQFDANDDAVRHMDD